MFDELLTVILKDAKKAQMDVHIWTKSSKSLTVHLLSCGM